MSTRSIVGTFDLDTGQFKGLYVHANGYPSNRGPVLAKILANVDGDLEVLNRTIAAQVDGWSRLDGEGTYNSLGDDRARLIAGFGLAYDDGGDPDDQKYWATGTLGQKFLETAIEWGYFFTSDDPATAHLLITGFPYPAGPAGMLSAIPVQLLHHVTDDGWDYVEKLKYSGEHEPNYGVTDLASLRSYLETATVDPARPILEIGQPVDTEIVEG